MVMTIVVAIDVLRTVHLNIKIKLFSCCLEVDVHPTRLESGEWGEATTMCTRPKCRPAGCENEGTLEYKSTYATCSTPV